MQASAPKNFLHRTFPAAFKKHIKLRMQSDLITSLAHTRKAQQLTQAELAERAGLSRMTVQRLESSGLDPRLSTLHELARVLDLELVAVPTALRASVQALIDTAAP